MRASVATTRAHPTPRNEGMANIVAATIRLLETTKPQNITLRDVARESGHGHRLIVEWFGGKGGLFAAVVDEIFVSLAKSGSLFYSDLPLRVEFRTAIQIFNFMQMHHPEFVEEVRSGIASDAAKERLRTVVGLPAETARVAIDRLAVQVMGIVLFREYFSLSDDEVIRMMKEEFKATTGRDLPDNPERQ